MLLVQLIWNLPGFLQEQKIIYPALKAINRVTGATGRYGVIVVKGDSQTGKTAICRQLVERATGFDNFQVITEVKSDLSIANMARATIDALENANNYRNSLIVIDDFDSLLLDKNPCWSPDKVFRLWRRLTGKSEGKNIALLVTTCMDLNELVKISTLKEIREYIHLPDKLTQNEINELMTAWDVDQQAKKDISRIFAEGCPVKEFHNLFEHYKNDPLEEGGSVTWDIEGMKRDFQRGRVISEQKSMSAFGIYS
ncbi:AAA family ATPase [Endozoicomonas sp. YOMI1]|uniref:AAA family ATPase n=1 Tax=Endozoicomonas sp. YOMI1 TaxID=2828739 RepID=UPI0021472F83|nr:AAA family ATPase [Endozoicomonas sp. YOMI1]